MNNKYYNGVIEQVYTKAGTTARNIAIVNYSNDFSIRSLDAVTRYSAEQGDVYFAWKEFHYGRTAGAYEPFLDIICGMHRAYAGGDFSQFLEACGVYPLQRSVLLSYYETGVCEREENVLLNEVGYEQEQMTSAMVTMLKNVAEIHPVVIVLNRFQWAAPSTMQIVRQLLREPSEHIGIVLGMNETQFAEGENADVWNDIIEMVEDSSLRYHIGSTGRRRERTDDESYRAVDFAKELTRLKNMIALLDLEQARKLCSKIEHSIQFEEMSLPQEIRLAFFLDYARTSILLGELPKALEIVEDILRLNVPGKEHVINFESAYLIATCYMYQGKLENAASYARMAQDEAQEHGTEEEVFLTELLLVQAQMSGWYNIFFCVQDIPISESLLEKMMRYNYRNHLAHVYIYAYDNRPEVVAKAYRSEAALLYFSKGVALAKEIGNAKLVNAAYQKNVMIASTNGMNEIALLYSVRSYQFMRGKDLLSDGRNWCGIGYNLSALGYNEEAKIYYDRAVDVFYRLRLPQDIAEVYYNRALNNIMLDRYAEAEHELHLSMKVIERLHLNSLRVCNLSKLYALLALACILQGDQFNCERYLFSCRQFLNYIIEKEKENGNSEIIHDYAKCDDDMFLYTFSRALLRYMEQDNEGALEDFENAEDYLKKAEGNQFFAYRIFRRKRMELFERMGRTELYEQEKVSLQQYVEMNDEISRNFSPEILDEIEYGDDDTGCIPEEEIEVLIKQEGLAKDYQNSKRQMEFISAWQKIIDVPDADIHEVVDNAIQTFIHHFSTDRLLYIWYEDGQPEVLYNDTGVDMDEETLTGLERAMRDYPQGFAVSKISDSFFEHQDIISYFDVNDVCSFVAIPFFRKSEIGSLLVTYVRMKDNWHSSIEKYMLDEDDLNIYQLLFRELNYSINRMESNRKVHEMNKQLQLAAVTDMLTGIYNRAGMYEQIHLFARNGARGTGLMFIDLDNFKHYNDTYGHDVGDLILKGMASIFTDIAKDIGFVCRYGGDEFIIFLGTDDPTELEYIAKEIYRRIDATEGFKAEIEEYLGHPVTVDEGRKITCSIGIASAPDVHSEEEINSLIRKADDLLYSVKTAEKGRYAFL
jgi:diguanylate cyclase (GGDEF)-like protein